MNEPIGNAHGPTWHYHWRTVTEECAREFWRGAQMGAVLTCVVLAFAFMIWADWRGINVSAAREAKPTLVTATGCSADPGCPQ